MKNKVLLVLLWLVCACSSGQKHKQYLALLKEADTINLVYPTKSKSIALTQEETQYLKEALTHDLNIEQKRDIRPTAIIELLKQEKKIGTFSIQQDGQVSFVNFDSDSLAFGFRLTYGIGMFINEKR